MSIANYLIALDAQRDQLARNLVTMGVQASESEKLNTLVPKVLQIPSGRPEVMLFRNGNDALTTYGESIYTFYIDGYRSIAGFADVYTLEGLVAMTMKMADVTIHDEMIVMTRKLLTIEQFRDERARELATKHFMTGLTDMFTHIFEGMMNKGLLRRDDPEMLAFAYTAPISALIHLCDREPEKAEEAIAQIEAFSRHFIKTYA